MKRGEKSVKTREKLGKEASKMLCDNNDNVTENSFCAMFLPQEVDDTALIR